MIDPLRMKGWVGLVGWPTTDVWPTKWSSVQLAVRRRTGKVRRSNISVLPLCYAANILAGDSTLQPRLIFIRDGCAVRIFLPFAVYAVVRSPYSQQSSRKFAVRRLPCPCSFRPCLWQLRSSASSHCDGRIQLTSSVVTKKPKNGKIQLRGNRLPLFLGTRTLVAKCRVDHVPKNPARSV